VSDAHPRGGLQGANNAANAPILLAPLRLRRLGRGAALLRQVNPTAGIALPRALLFGPDEQQRDPAEFFNSLLGELMRKGLLFFRPGK